MSSGQPLNGDTLDSYSICTTIERLVSSPDRATGTKVDLSPLDSELQPRPALQTDMVPASEARRRTNVARHDGSNIISFFCDAYLPGALTTRSYTHRCSYHLNSSMECSWTSAASALRIENNFYE